VATPRRGHDLWRQFFFHHGSFLGFNRSVVNAVDTPNGIRYTNGQKGSILLPFLGSKGVPPMPPAFPIVQKLLVMGISGDG